MECETCRARAHTDATENTGSERTVIHRVKYIEGGRVTVSGALKED